MCRIIRLTALCVIAILTISCATKYVPQEIVLPTFSIDSLIPRFGEEIVNPMAPLPLKEKIRLYAPFCNWKDDTIVLQTEIFLPGLDTYYYSQSPSRNIYCVSKFSPHKQSTKQMLFSSIYDYVMPVDSLPEPFQAEAMEAIKVDLEFKHWQTDSIERRLKSLEGSEKYADNEAKRIIIHNGKIIKVETYKYYGLHRNVRKVFRY